MIDYFSGLLVEPPSTNVAWQLVKAVLPTDTSSPWGTTLQLFGIVLFFICGLKIAFGTVQGIVASAYTGKVLGDRWHQIWTPLRIVLGLGLLVPMSSGFSPAHYLLRDVVARGGINLADDAWKIFVSVIVEDGTTIIPTSSAGSTVAMAVLRHEVCAAEDDAERQANQFASAFLMPEADLKNSINQIYSSSQIIKAKGRWKVSAMALAMRLNQSRMLSDWNYRSIVIDLGQQGYRTGEPLGVDRETSTLLAKVFATLWSKGLTKRDIANDLNLPWEEIESLVFGLTGSALARPPKGSLTIVN